MRASIRLLGGVCFALAAAACTGDNFTPVGPGPASGSAGSGTAGGKPGGASAGGTTSAGAAGASGQAQAGSGGVASTGGAAGVGDGGTSTQGGESGAGNASGDAGSAGDAGASGDGGAAGGSTKGGAGGGGAGKAGNGGAAGKGGAGATGGNGTVAGASGAAGATAAGAAGTTSGGAAGDSGAAGDGGAAGSSDPGGAAGKGGAGGGGECTKDDHCQQPMDTCGRNKCLGGLCILGPSAAPKPIPDVTNCLQEICEGITTVVSTTPEPFDRPIATTQCGAPSCAFGVPTFTDDLLLCANMPCVDGKCSGTCNTCDTLGGTFPLGKATVCGLLGKVSLTTNSDVGDLVKAADSQLATVWLDDKIRTAEAPLSIQIDPVTAIKMAQIHLAIARSPGEKAKRVQMSFKLIVDLAGDPEFDERTIDVLPNEEPVVTFQLKQPRLVSQIAINAWSKETAIGFREIGHQDCAK